jgi:hypothetical protein
VEDLNPTVRKYPRTLNEAFPEDAASWFEEPKQRIGWWDIGVVGLALVMWYLIVLIWSKS